MSYLLSIVIPTRNRQMYAIASVKQCLEVTDERTQIVVSDNSDNDSLQGLINELRSSRVKYKYTKTRIPGVDNYANGIEMSDGEYLCCIGDDDGVLPFITDITEWASSAGEPIVKPGVHASYIWPNVVEYYKTGCLGLDNVSSRYWYEDVQQELVNFLHTGCDDLPKAHLPKAYHGLVRKDMFEEIHRRTGRYCGGLSPDIYLSMSLSLLVDRVLCIDIPLTIFGACKASTTGDSLNKCNKGKLEDAPHFVGQPYTWSNKVPRYYCGANIWADSALHALEDMGAQDMVNEFSVERLSCYGLLYQRIYREEIMDNLEKNCCDKKALKCMMRKEYPYYLLRTIKTTLRNNKLVFGLYVKLRKLRQKNSQAFSMPGVEDISSAAQIITRAIRSQAETLTYALRTKGSKQNVK